MRRVIVAACEAILYVRVEFFFVHIKRHTLGVPCRLVLVIPTSRSSSGRSSMSSISITNEPPTKRLLRTGLYWDRQNSVSAPSFSRLIEN